MKPVWLVDASVIMRLTEPAIAKAVRPLMERGIVATCATIDLQLFGAIEDPEHLDKTSALRASVFQWLSTWDEDMRTALAYRRSIVHAGLAPTCQAALVVAAVARRHQVGVLHHDPCYDGLAKVVDGLTTRWAVGEQPAAAPVLLPPEEPWGKELSFTAEPGMPAAKPVRAEVIERAVQLYAEVKSVRVVADELHVRYTTMRTWLRDAGVELEPRGGRKGQPGAAGPSGSPDPGAITR